MVILFKAPFLPSTLQLVHIPSFLILPALSMPALNPLVTLASLAPVTPASCIPDHPRPNVGPGPRQLRRSLKRIFRRWFERGDDVWDPVFL
jgi:hypothetical protein